MPFYLATIIKPEVLVRMFSSIKSPFFCEFVLELIALPPQFGARSLDEWGRWKEVDKFLDEKFCRRGRFRVIIRTDKPYGQAICERYAKGGFPLLVGRGCIHFE